MANTSSAKKAARQAVKRTAINKARKTKMRTQVRRAEEALAGKDPAAAISAMRAAESAMMKAAQNGAIHKNTAARKASRMAARQKKMAASA
jgi:small subunit ribosomal protein S20